MKNQDVIALFATRDEAVMKHDRKLFLSTQIDEIEHGSSDDYLAIEHMKSEVLYIHDENELDKAVFVKETYAPENVDPHSSFPVYFLTHTVKGWRIYRVR